jgi:oligopeptide transport system substrate-binding protein
VELDAMEFKVLIKKRNDGEYQIARNGWVADYNDATTFLTLVQCDSDQNARKTATARPKNSSMKATKAWTRPSAKSFLTQAAKMIMDDYPMMPLLQYTLPRLVKSYVGGYTKTNSMDRYRAKEFYIIKH